MRQARSWRQDQGWPARQMLPGMGPRIDGAKQHSIGGAASARKSGAMRRERAQHTRSTLHLLPPPLSPVMLCYVMSFVRVIVVVILPLFSKGRGGRRTRAAEPLNHVPVGGWWRALAVLLPAAKHGVHACSRSEQPSSTSLQLKRSTREDEVWEAPQGLGNCRMGLPRLQGPEEAAQAAAGAARVV